MAVANTLAYCKTATITTMKFFLVQTQDPVSIGAINFGRIQELLTKPTSLNINANREAAIIKLFTIVNYHTSLYTLEGC
jgi:hypothetical protein